MPISPALTLPTVGASSGTWGGTLNVALGSIETWLNRALAFDVRGYGAAVDNSTNDASAVQAAITAASAAGGGEVLIPGQCAIGSTLTLPSNVVLTGYGRGRSRLRKTFSGTPLIDHSGSGTSGDGSTHVHYGGLRHLTLHGGDTTGPILRTYYADQFYALDVHFVQVDDSAVDAVELWDSRFTACDFTNASGAAKPSIYLRSSSAASGFGSSIDNVNNVYFVQSRIEGFRGGALWVAKGPAAGASDAYGIFVVNTKAETHTTRGDVFSFADSTTHCHLVNTEIYVGPWDSGYTTPVKAIAAQGYGINSYRNVRVVSETSGVVHSGIWAYSGAGVTVIDGYQYRGQAPTSGCINYQDWGGGNGDIRVYNARCDSGLTLHAGSRAPTAAYGAGAGTAPSGLAVAGSNLCHTVSMTTGTSTSAAVIATITLAGNLGGAPRAIVSPRNANAAAARLYVSSTSATQIVVSAQTAPTASTALSFDVLLGDI